MASQEVIKKLGTNGGGFFNANSAHPFENPTPLTNLLEMLAIFAIGAALTYTFGQMVGDTRQGWALLAAMAVSVLIGVGVALLGRAGRQPVVRRSWASTSAPAPSGGRQHGRQGGALRHRQLVLCSPSSPPTPRAARSTAMHDSYTPLGGMIPLLNIQLGEIIFGGVGSGLYGMLMFAILAVFIAGLMVGRTPEYLGKKIEANEMKMAMLAILILPAQHPGLHRAGQRRSRQGSKRPLNPARTGSQRDPLRLHLGHRQQRLRLRRAERQHAVLQPDRSAWPC